MSFCWAVYLFSNGHFSSTIQSQNLPFNVSLACDPSEAGRSLFVEFAPNAKVFSSGNDLLQHVRVSGETSVLHGNLINSYRFLNSEVTTNFWKQQLAIIMQLRLIRNLLAVVAIIMPDHDGRSVKSFIRGLSTAHWKVSSRDISYPEIGDSIVNSCRTIIAIHSSSAPVVEPIVLKTLPAVQPRPIASYLWEPFNRLEHSLCFGCDDSDFNKDKASWMTVSTPKPAELGGTTLITILYHLHRADADATILAGSSILSQSSLCPPFELVQQETYSNISSGLSSTSTATPMSARSRLLSLLVASTLLKTSSTASLTKNINLGWTLRCQRGRPRGSFRRSILNLFFCAI
jgi:hypothetical protein